VTSVRVLAPALVCGLLLAGCTSGPDDDSARTSDAPVVQLGAPGEDNETLSPEDHETLGDAPPATAADVAFVQGMVAHHRQALTMAAMVERRHDDPRIPLFAERLAVSQRAEIAQMRDWLAQHGGDHASHGSHHQHHLMPGMLTRPELAQLRRADGRRFDRLFLLSMIRHHEGAIAMVNDLLGDGDGQEPAVFQMAQHVDSDQRVEISRMKSLLRGR